MRNFPVTVDGIEHWISRSCVVIGLVYKINENGEIFILANKRGIGCPNYVGEWNITAGFVDYDETIQQAVSRETFEETGLNIYHFDWKLWKIKSEPSDDKQAISFRFVVEYKDEYGEFSKEHSEPNEVDDIQWISENDIDKYEWAFNHKEVIEQFLCHFKYYNLKEELRLGIVNYMF